MNHNKSDVRIRFQRAFLPRRQACDGAEWSMTKHCNGQKMAEGGIVELCKCPVSTQYQFDIVRQHRWAFEKHLEIGTPTQASVQTTLQVLPISPITSPKVVQAFVLTQLSPLHITSSGFHWLTFPFLLQASCLMETVLRFHHSDVHACAPQERERLSALALHQEVP